MALFEDVGEIGPTYHAVAGGNQTMGRTAGEALDALTPRVGTESSDTLIIVRNLRPVHFFPAEQQRRLGE